MKKLTLICFGLINAFLLTACSSNNNNSSNNDNSTASWHNTNSPFTLDSGSTINNNIFNSINLFSGFNNGKRYFVMPGNGSLWLNSNNSWEDVTPPTDLMPSSEDFINFNVDPTSKTVLAITSTHALMYFNGSSWINAKLDSCLTEPEFIADFAINADFTVATILGNNGEICQYNSLNNQWHKTTIDMPDDVDQMNLSNYANGSGLYAFNSELASLTYFSDVTKPGVTIPSVFSPADLLDAGDDAFVANLNNNRVVLFSKTKNDFYYYANENWTDTQLDIAQYGATKVIDRAYYYDEKGNPYIFVALDNMKVLAYYEGNWKLTPISMPSTGLLSEFIVGMSTSSIRLFIEYQNGEDVNNEMNDILYDYTTNQVLDLNQHDEFMGMFGSPNLNYIYGLDDEYNLYKLDIATHQWNNTNFKLTNYGSATGISAINVTNDGIAVLSLTNGAVVSYY